MTLLEQVVRGFAREAVRSLQHPLVQGAGALATSRYVTAGLNLLTTVVAARLLGPDSYGVAALTIAYPTLVFSFVSVKSSSIAARYISGFRVSGHDHRVGSICKLGYALDFGTAIIGVLLVMTSGWWVVRFVYEMPDLFWLMVAYGAAFPFHSLTMTSYGVLSALQQFRWMAALEILGAMIPLLIVTGLLRAGFGIPGFVLGTALGHAVIGGIAVGVATYLLFRNEMGYWWRAPLGELLPLKEELAAFWGWNYAMVTLSGLMMQVPLMLIGRLSGPREAGFYRLALGLVVVGSYLETSLGQVIYPSLSERWAGGGRGDIQDSLQRWTFRIGVTLGAILLLAIPFLPLAIPVLFGAAYSPMVPGVQVMMAGSALSAVFFWTISFYYATGKIAFWTKAYGLYTAVVVGVGAVLMERWGFFGLAVVVALSKAAFSIVMGLFAFREGRL